MIAIVSIIVFQSCKTTQYTPTDYPDPQITFGSGGGVAGIFNEYTLFQNGALYQKEGQTEVYNLLKKVNKNQAKQIFKTMTDLNLLDVKFDQPGNMSYFLKYKHKDKTHNITWSDGGQPNDNVKTIYQILNSFIKE